MSWLQVELTATALELAEFEKTLLSFGALAVSLLSHADEPVLEPMPGETPMWSEVRMQALFDPGLDIAGLRAALVMLVPDVETTHELDIVFVGDEDWQESAKTYAVSQIFADRLWLLPKPQTQASDDAADGMHDREIKRLYLEPGLAFGSGSHPTTNLCLQWIAEHTVSGFRVLDFGCGSGILGIAAALLGAQVVAVDHDEQAVVSTNENRDYNGLSHENLTTLNASNWYASDYLRSFDVVVANILAAPLQDLADEFENVAKSGAFIILSGVLAEQASAVMARYTRTKFVDPIEMQGWVCLVGQKNN